MIRHNTVARHLDLVSEDARIARHLAGAEQQLRARDVRHLSHAHRVVRSFVIEALRSYRLAGRFPRNLVRSARTPVFIDPYGTRCAMAHLLEAVGAHALVARVARDANLARIHDLAGDPELSADAASPRAGPRWARGAQGPHGGAATVDRRANQLPQRESH